MRKAVRSAGSPLLLRQFHPPLGLLVQQLVEFIVTLAPFGEIFGRAFAHRHLLLENLLLDFHIGDVGLQGFQLAFLFVSQFVGLRCALRFHRFGTGGLLNPFLDAPFLLALLPVSCLLLSTANTTLATASNVMIIMIALFFLISSAWPAGLYAQALPPF